MRRDDTRIRLIWLLPLLQLVAANPPEAALTPHTETIRVGASNHAQLLRQPGLLQGMDPAAVEELLRTGKPVERVTVDAGGNRRTSTYKIEPDGSISSHTSTEMRPQHWVINSYGWDGSSAPHRSASSTAEWFTPESRPVQLPRSWDPNTWPRRTYPHEPEWPSRAAQTPAAAEADIDDLVKTLYEPSTASATPTATAKPVGAATPTATPRPTTTIDINALPVTAILQHGRPVHDESFLRTLPPHLRPVAPETSVRSFSKTIHSGAPPTAADLDPGMQDILSRAGIDPAAIRGAPGEVITRTRTEPDGRVITTSYRVRTVPHGDATTSSHIFPQPRVLPDPAHAGAGLPAWPQLRPPYRTTPPTAAAPSTTTPMATPSASAPPTFGAAGYSPIRDFLAKNGLTLGFIEAQKEPYEKTIIDDDGRVLTVTFALSSMLDPSDPNTIK